MKKLIIAALLVILGLFLIKTRAPWHYEITVNGHNAPMTIKVTMVNGKFKSIEVPRESETIGVGKKALEILTKRIVEEQSLAVDAVSGATVTSYALLGGVEAALQNSKVSTDRFKAKKEAAPAEQEQLTADVIVVGGGAGLAAAISAEQNGADVLVLQRLDFLGGSTNVSEGALNAVDPGRQIPQGIEDSVEKFIDQTYHGGHETGEMDLITYMCSHAMESVEWMESIGVTFNM